MSNIDIDIQVLYSNVIIDIIGIGYWAQWPMCQTAIIEVVLKYWWPVVSIVPSQCVDDQYYYYFNDPLCDVRD